MKHLRIDRRGISSIIVVMLSLVLIVIVVSNVILWSYQMNQLDWEKMQEKIILTNAEQVTHSPWFICEDEYATSIGTRIGGVYMDTWAVNEAYETFQESDQSIEDSHGLEVTGGFQLDLSTYPRQYIKSVEIQLRYRASDSFENWLLKAFNWTEGRYSSIGFNATTGNIAASEFKYYSVNLTDRWTSYVQADGAIRVEFCDMMPDSNQTTVDIDFLGVRAAVDGAKLMIRNEGSLTCRIVAVWTINQTMHRRYSSSFFVNAGTNMECVRADVALPTGDALIKVVTERGNIAVFRKDQ